MSKRDRAIDILRAMDDNHLDDVLKYLERLRLGQEGQDVYVGEFPDVIGGIGGRDKRS